MKFQLRAVILLIIIIITLSTKINLSQSESHPEIATQLITRVTAISFDFNFEGDGYTSFEIHYTAEIWNRYGTSIEVSHPDTCRFHLNIDFPKIDNSTRIYISAGCGDAITPETYPSGIKEQTGTTWVTIEDEEYHTLPDGRYGLTLGDSNSWSYENNVSFVKSYMLINNGILLFEPGAFPDWGNTEESLDTKSESLNVEFSSFGLTIFSFTFFIILKKQMRQLLT